MRHLRELVAQGWISKGEEFLSTLGRIEARFRSIAQCMQAEAAACIPAVAEPVSG
jgi:hypothetical protein